MNMTRRSSDRRWLLREATAKAHADLDATIGLFEDRGGYEAYLTSLHAFRAPLEPVLRSIGGWTPTALLPLIEADLADLGLPAPPPRPAPEPADIFGTLYVLEGSVLGGQILRRRAAALGLGDQYGARHLAGAVGNWMAFLAILDAADPFDADAAADAANATFTFAQNAFTKAIA